MLELLSFLHHRSINQKAFNTWTRVTPNFCTSTKRPGEVPRRFFGGLVLKRNCGGQLLCFLLGLSRRHDTAPWLFVSDAEGVNSHDFGGGAVVARHLPLQLARQFRETLHWDVEPGRSGSSFFNKEGPSGAQILDKPC